MGYGLCNSTGRGIVTQEELQHVYREYHTLRVHLEVVMILCAVCHKALLPGEVMTRKVLTVFGNSKVQHVCSSCHSGTRVLLKGRKSK